MPRAMRRTHKDAKSGWGRMALRWFQRRLGTPATTQAGKHDHTAQVFTQFPGEIKEIRSQSEPFMARNRSFLTLPFSMRVICRPQGTRRLAGYVANASGIASGWVGVQGGGTCEARHRGARTGESSAAKPNLVDA